MYIKQLIYQGWQHNHAVLINHNNTTVLNRNFVYEFCRFRTLNHKLPIEKGRWENIETNPGTYNFCNKDEIGEDFHFSLECKHFENSWKTYIDAYYRKSVVKFGEPIKSKNKVKISYTKSKSLIKLCVPLAKFLYLSVFFLVSFFSTVINVLMCICIYVIYLYGFREYIYNPQLTI